MQRLLVSVRGPNEAQFHGLGKESWVAGSVSKEQLPKLWGTGVDVICARDAACEARDGESRFGEVTTEIVVALVGTIPKQDTGC